jgi:hypothetical protein
MARVLRPGGTLLLHDHVGSSWPLLHAVQRLVERSTIRAAGEHFTRRQRPLVVAAGLRITEAQRLRAGTVERIAATKPVDWMPPTSGPVARDANVPGHR